MNHRRKLEYLDRLLAERGLSKANAKPPFFRFLWLLGIEVPPPYFLSFLAASLWIGVPFGLIFAFPVGGLVWLVADSLPAVFRIGIVVNVVVMAGTLFGVSMAFLWGRQRDQLDLPAWDEFPRRKDRPAAPESAGGGA